MQDKQASGLGRFRGVPADVIKLTAIVTMLIDHIGAIFYSSLNPGVYMLMRAVGRIAFPLFAFCIVEGYTHTRSVPKYLLRLSLFAVLSELPFDYAFFAGRGGLMYWGHQNVFVTLALGLAAVWLIDRIRISFSSMSFFGHLAQLLLLVLAVFLSAFLADILGGDYGHMGVLLVILFYFAKGGKLWQCLCLVAWLLYYDLSLGRLTEAYAVVDVLPILFYNGEKGKLPVPRLLFYAFYPLHLLVLAWLRGFLF